MKNNNSEELTTQLKKKPFLVRLREEKYLQLMALLGVVWMLIFNYAPMYGILIAFKKNYRITTPLFSMDFLKSAWATKGGFQHFINFFKDDEFVNILTNTLGISIIKLFINFPLPIIFALMLNEVRNAKFKKFIQTVSYMPHFLSWVVLGGILTTWLGETGLLNELLVKFGFIKQGIPYLAYPKYFWPIVVLSDLWKELGWSAIIYLAAISSIVVPILKPLGMGDWRIATSLFSGFIAKESVVSTLQILFAGAVITEVIIIGKVIKTETKIGT